MSSSLPSGPMRRAVLGARPSSARIAADVSSAPDSAPGRAVSAKRSPTRPRNTRRRARLPEGLRETGRARWSRPRCRATPRATPMPISVHMLGLRLAIDCAQRTKNGQPAHSTTGVDSRVRARHRAWRGSEPRKMPAHCEHQHDELSGSVHQKRRREVASVRGCSLLVEARHLRLEGHAADRAVPGAARESADASGRRRSCRRRAGPAWMATRPDLHDRDARHVRSSWPPVGLGVRALPGWECCSSQEGPRPANELDAIRRRDRVCVPRIPSCRSRRPRNAP